MCSEEQEIQHPLWNPKVYNFLQLSYSRRIMHHGVHKVGYDKQNTGKITKLNK